MTVRRIVDYYQLSPTLHGGVKLEFHDADTDTDTDGLAMILADTSDARDFLKLFLWQAERHGDILATIHARISARMSVSVSVSVTASWNASLTADSGPLAKAVKHGHSPLPLPAVELHESQGLIESNVNRTGVHKQDDAQPSTTS